MKTFQSACVIAALVFGAEAATSSFLQEGVDEVSQMIDGPMAVSDVEGIWKSCPNTQAQQNFDKEKYLGAWYELHRAKVQNIEDGECVRAVYSARDDGLIGVENSQAKMKDDGTFAPRDGVYGKAKQFHPEKNEGTLGVKFSAFQPVWGPYDVLYTDYENITVIHSCFSLGFWKSEQQWVLTRKPLNPDSDGKEYDEAVAKAKEVLESQLPDFKFEDQMRPTIQGEDKNCEYYSP